MFFGLLRRMIGVFDAPTPICICKASAAPAKLGRMGVIQGQIRDDTAPTAPPPDDTINTLLFDSRRSSLYHDRWPTREDEPLLREIDITCASVQDFKALAALYSGDAFNRRVVVTVRNRLGRCYVDEYIGKPARHIKVTDHLGRIRTKRGGVRRLRDVSRPSD